MAGWPAYEKAAPVCYHVSTTDMLAIPVIKASWKVGEEWCWKAETVGDLELLWLKARCYEIRVEPFAVPIV